MPLQPLLHPALPLLLMLRLQCYPQAEGGAAGLVRDKALGSKPIKL